MQIKSIPKKFLNRSIVFFIPLCLSVMVWMNPRFFTPDSFINYGDMAFPLNPKIFLKAMIFLWIDSNGTGVHSVYSAFLIPSLLFSFFETIRVPLWIINRFWVVLPLASVGWATYYLYRVIMSGKYAFVGGMIAAVFAMFSPVSEIYSYQFFSLAGFALTFAVVIQLLDGKKGKFTLLAAGFGGITLLCFTPRYLYMALLCCALYLALWAVQQKKIDLSRLKRVFIIFFMVILLSAYLLVPLFIFLYVFKSGAASELYGSGRTPEGYQTGLDLWNNYKSWVTPLWAMRLLTSNPYSPLTPLVKTFFISIISFIMPGYAYFSLVLNKNRKLTRIAIISICFLCLAVSPTYIVLRNFYLLLFTKLPGFFIFKSPIFFLLFLGVFYALLTGATTQALLKIIDESKKTLFSETRRMRIKQVLVGALLLIILFVYGGALLIGKSPKKNRAGWGDTIYGNHIISAQIPKEYFLLSEYLRKNATDSQARILNLPWTRGGYIPYSWWNYYDMPEVMNELSPLPILGASFPPSRGWLVSLGDTIIDKDADKTQKLLKLLGIRYILIHKDYALPGEYNTVCKYIEYFKNDKENFTQVMENKYFLIFEGHIKQEKIFSI